MRRFASALLVALVVAQGVALADHDASPIPWSQVVEPGFTVTPYAAGLGAATSLTFGPDGHLYVASFAGTISRVRDAGSMFGIPGLDGLVGLPPEVVASGFSSPLGVHFGPDGALYVASIDPDNTTDGRTWGMVSRLELDGAGAVVDQRKVLVDLPNGRHNTNGIATGPDGLLYVANGNATDDGVAGGDPEILPLSGSVVRFDIADATDEPLSAMAYAGSGEGADPVDVIATGMRNVYDLVFRGDDLLVTTNGPDAQDPLGEDTLVVIEDAPSVSLADGNMPDFGFPGCLHTHDEFGQPVATDATTPNREPWFQTCDTGVTDPLAVLGLHVSADGVDIAPDGFGEFGGDVFIAQFGNFFGEAIVGHQVQRVGLDAEGSVSTDDGGVVDIGDFMVGVAPLDLVFGPGGALFVADFGSGTVLRVAPAV